MSARLDTERVTRAMLAMKPARRAWTPDDHAFLAAHYRKRGLAWCAAKLERTPRAVAAMVQKHGLAKRRRWTAAEDAYLAREWGEVCPRVLRKGLPGRTWTAIVGRAVAALGLDRGIPQGYVSLHEAAHRLGYTDSAFVQRLAARHGVAIRLHPRPRDVGAKRSPRRCVEWDAIRDALTREMSTTESVHAGAAARGVCGVTLWRWLNAAGVLPPRPEGHAHRGTARVLSTEIDRVVAERRARGVR